MDFIIGMPFSKGKDVIFVVVDHLTKYAHLVPLTTKFTMIQIVDLFF
jgi:hypothetical protein